MHEKVRWSGRSRPIPTTRSLEMRRNGVAIRKRAPRPRARARSMARRNAGLPSGNGLAFRIPDTRTGMPRRAQKVAALANREMFRPGM
jgi:hypothetical protein